MASIVQLPLLPFQPKGCANTKKISGDFYLKVNHMQQHSTFARTNVAKLASVGGWVCVCVSLYWRGRAQMKIELFKWLHRRENRRVKMKSIEHAHMRLIL